MPPALGSTNCATAMSVGVNGADGSEKSPAASPLCPRTAHVYAVPFVRPST